MAAWVANATMYLGLVSVGVWVVRQQRGKTAPSVHGTGRAVDLSYRAAGRARGLNALRWLELHAETLGVELMLDYFPKPFGRGWRCDRGRDNRGDWGRYSKPTIGGAPGGDWIHVEVSPEALRSVQIVQEAWKTATGPETAARVV
jgi:hypothetical protein